MFAYVLIVCLLIIAYCVIRDSAIVGSSVLSVQPVSSIEHYGTHSAYVPGVYTGYIPMSELRPNIPDGLPRCIDGDSLRPCWDMENGQVIIQN